MAWNSYGLDREAQKLVLAAKQRDKDSLNQSHKMRMAVACRNKCSQVQEFPHSYRLG